MTPQRRAELNAKIAKWMGWPQLFRTSKDRETGRPAPDYLTDRAASMEVLEKLLTVECAIQVGESDTGYWVSSAAVPEDIPDWHVESGTLREAIALAAETVIDRA